MKEPKPKHAIIFVMNAMEKAAAQTHPDEHGYPAKRVAFLELLDQLIETERERNAIVDDLKTLLSSQKMDRELADMLRSVLKKHGNGPNAR